MRICGIYAIINTETDEVYIGHATDMKKRWSHHRRYLDLGEHPYDTLNDGWLKDVVKFDILEECTEDELQDKEDDYMNYMSLVGYNVINKNHAGRSFKNSPEARKNKSEAQIGQKNGNHRLFDEDIIKIKKYYRDGKYNATQLAKIFGISESHLYKIVNGLRWKHIKI